MVKTIKFSQFSAASLNDSSRTVVGTASGANYILPDQNQWTTSTRPLSPFNGLMGFNSTINQWEFWQTSTLMWVPFSSGGGSGTVTEIITGTGLTGGPITTSGTISLANVASNTLLANITGSPAPPVPVSISSLLDSTLSGTQGSIIYRNNTSWVALAPGNDGQFLKTGGPGANPSWTNSAGTGTVNAGLMNQMAWYAADGTAVSGLATAANGILVTSSLGVPSISNTLPSGLTIPKPLIQGVTNASAAPAGYVGEVLSHQSSGFSTSLTTDTPANATSLNLTAGDWDVYATMEFQPGGANGGVQYVGCISTVSGTFQPLSVNNAYAQHSFTSGTGLNTIISLGCCQINVASPTTIYLVVQAAFSGSMSAGGLIWARRAR